jgi:hypothetical protein
MGTKTFDDFLASIQAKIGNLNNTLTVLRKQAASFQRRANAGNQQAALDLVTTQADITKKEETSRSSRSSSPR